MKKEIVAVFMVALLASVFSAGCGGVVTGSGNVETKQFSLIDFAKVDISSAFEFEIVQSDSYNISITADDNIIEHVQVSKEGETLKIGLKTIAIRWPITLKALVAMPQLRALNLSGATRGTISEFSSTENVDLTVSGASTVTGDMAAGDFNLFIEESSTVQLEGSAGNMVAVVTGASKIKLAGFAVNNANVTLEEASTGSVNLSGRLDANLSGASHLKYIGEPTLGKMNITEASSLNKQ